MAADPEPGPVNWEAIDLILMARRGLKPWELDRLTLSELCLLLEDEEKPRAPAGNVPRSDEEMIAYARFYQSMTVLQKLNAARRGEL